ncbi:MAG: hypothetical protein ABSA68_11640 [Xanthobacteraceae bacterium]|jgi:hypothetical protein
MSNKVKIVPPERLEHSPGYFPDGASIYSHAAAKGRANNDPKFRDRVPRERQEFSRLDEMIKNEQYQVERLERRAKEARETGDRVRFLGICSRLRRTRDLLARLRAEQQRGAS